VAVGKVWRLFRPPSCESCLVTNRAPQLTRDCPEACGERISPGGIASVEQLLHTIPDITRDLVEPILYVLRREAELRAEFADLLECRIRVASENRGTDLVADGLSGNSWWRVHGDG
jgi:hypothetical protein